jgi:hypothetical protein
MTVIEQREQLVEMITDSLGQLVSSVTIDAQDARPLPGKAVVCIEPPEMDYEGWDLTTVTWKACVIAGTTATQVAAMDVILPVLEKLQSDHINVAKAEPVTWHVNGGGDVAAYEITFNPLD